MFPFPCSIVENYCAFLNEPKCDVNGICKEERNRATYDCICNDCWEDDRCSTPIDLCDPNECLNNSECVMANDCKSFLCNCENNCHTGTYCEIYQDQCLAAGEGCDECTPNSDCTDYSCNCKLCYTGPKCETIMNACEGITCLNGGRCKQSQDCLRWECVNCDPNYFGEICQWKIDGCLDALCHNGGECVTAHSETVDPLTKETVYIHHYCDCRGCYKGETCLLHGCDSLDCGPGTCKLDAVCENPTCDCGSCFTGDFCEVGVDTCVDLVCHNGGVCEQDWSQSVSGYISKGRILAPTIFENPTSQAVNSIKID